jgi:hypothetical protein
MPTENVRTLESNESPEQMAAMEVKLETTQAMAKIDMQQLADGIETAPEAPKAQLFLAYKHILDGNEVLARGFINKLPGKFLVNPDNFDFGVEQTEVLQKFFATPVDATTDRIDFGANKEAEQMIGCGNLYGPEWDGLAIDGVVGKRTINQRRNKVGYEGEDGYLAVYTGGVVKKMKVLVTEPEENPEDGIEYQLVDASVLDQRKQQELMSNQTFAIKMEAFVAENGTNHPEAKKIFDTDAFATFGDEVDDADVDLGTFKHSEKYKADRRTGGFKEPKMKQEGARLIAKKFGTIKKAAAERLGKSKRPKGNLNEGEYSRDVFFGRGGRYKRVLKLDKRWGKLHNKTPQEVKKQNEAYLEGLKKLETLKNGDYKNIVDTVCKMNGVQENYPDIATRTQTAEGRREYVDECAMRMAQGEYKNYPAKIATFREYAPFIIKQCHAQGMSEKIPWMLAKIRGEGGWNHAAALTDDVEDSRGFMGINVRVHQKRANGMGLDVKTNTLDNIAYGVWLLAYQGGRFGSHEQAFFMGIDRYGGNNAWKKPAVTKGFVRVAKNVHYFAS